MYVSCELRLDYINIKRNYININYLAIAVYGCVSCLYRYSVQHAQNLLPKIHVWCTEFYVPM